jgi:hemoglobin-like flavoprotein
MASLAELKEQVDDISNTYEARFAGHSRVTRDAGEMEELIKRTRDVVQQLEALPAVARGADADALLATARDALKLYQTERDAIAAAKGAGPDLEEFARLGTQANWVFARYRRHFAGKSRNTRDLGLLAEMIDDLTKIQQRMQPIANKHKGVEGLASDLELVSNNLKMYINERGEIADARGSGTPEEQADVLAEVANGQFKVYQDHFADKSRLTCRPQLLQRMIDNLKTVKDRMEGLRKGGLRSDVNAKNIDIVDQNLKMYMNEIAEIKKARASVKLSDLMGSLGSAANDVMAEYREHFAGKARKGRDLDRLSKLCDQLGEIARQMSDLGRAEVQEFNIKNLQIVSDNVVMLENEYDEIVKANAS